MSDDLSDLGELESIANAVARNLTGPERRKLLRRMAVAVRRSQSARIAAQRDPDGSAYAPRKNQPKTGKARAKKGSIRRGKMFRKLRQSKYLHIGQDQDGAWVGFSGAASRVARIHQDGDFDKPNKNALPMRYPRRTLLGLTQQERDLIADALLAQLNGE